MIEGRLPVPDATLQDVLACLEEYRTQVDTGRGPDPAWQRRESEIFARLARRFEELGQAAEAEEPSRLATEAARRAAEGS